MSVCNAVGLIDTNRIVGQDYLDLLSQNERARYGRMRDAERRKRWAGGRLLAKYLFLNRFGRQQRSAGFQRIEPFDISALETFPRWAYREIEILPERWAEGGLPRLSWAGRACPVRVSLSHISGLSGACISDAGDVGLDLAAPALRTPAFYRANFSKWERDWAEAAARSAGVARERVYTLLWCLKESALKSLQSDHISLWQLPRIQVRLRCGGEVLGESRDTSARLRLARAEVSRDGQTWNDAEVSLATTRQAILTVLRIH